MLLSNNEINPHIIKYDTFNGYELPKGTPLSSRVCYDYEIEHFQRCDGGIIIDGTYQKYKAGDICLLKPTQVVCGVMPYECSMIFVDMAGKKVYESNHMLGTPFDSQPLYENELLNSLPSKITPANPQLISRIFNDFLTIRHGYALDTIKMNKLVLELLYEMFEQTYGQKSVRPVANKYVTSAISHINKSFCDDINVMALIENSGLSKPYFHKCFKEYVGLTPYAMITSLRVDKAKKLLCMTQSSVTDIAASCGYNDNVYFSHIFKKHTGLTPTAYRLGQVYSNTDN